MAPTNAIAGPEVHDRGIMQLAPELTIDGPQQDGYSGCRCYLKGNGAVSICCSRLIILGRRTHPYRTVLRCIYTCGWRMK
ncbi:hypothetical protein EB834_20045 [Brevibacterium aurantiacum]|uniref:Uncharacterized protein n=1 Tax=Brevibacterium aurantiacum TaxID=273384 RepID=A0A4Z0KF60_BREAU|nr:hypothetical protein EB834_20045 [Brevibacterium aurantiacum]